MASELYRVFFPHIRRRRRRQEKLFSQTPFVLFRESSDENLKNVPSAPPSCR